MITQNYSTDCLQNSVERWHRKGKPLDSVVIQYHVTLELELWIIGGTAVLRIGGIVLPMQRLFSSDSK